MKCSSQTVASDFEGSHFRPRNSDGGICDDDIRYSWSHPLLQSAHSFALLPVGVQTSDAVVEFEYHKQ